MKEEIINLSGVIEYKELENGNVELIIRKQTKYHFTKEKGINGNHYCLGSCNCFDYHSSIGRGATLYLKGSCDSSRINLTFTMHGRDWPVFKEMLADEGFELIDANNPTNPTETQENEECKVKFEYVSEEPSEDEITKMIAQVDLNTFTNIIKARMREDGADGEDLGKINRNWAKEYLKQWAKAKYRLYKLLGNKLKVEKDLEIEPSVEEFRTMQKELMQKFPLYRPIIEHVYYEAFVKERIDTEFIWRDAFLDKRVTDGMSLTKFFALFGSEELNVELSKMYQNKGKAHLTISIDPNDYLTVSINSSGWRSCHNFINGEWRKCRTILYGR